MKFSKEVTQGETLCPACSADAIWVYLDKEGTRVEITCLNCGHIEEGRSEFLYNEAELAGVGDQHEA